MVTIEWTPLPEQLEFTVKYRKKGSPDAYWYEEATTESSITLTDVRPGDTIEYGLGTVCRYGSAPTFGRTDTVVVPWSWYSNPNCGQPPETEISNRNPLPRITSGEMFLSGDFPVYVKTFTYQNGILNGTGYTLLPGIFGDTKLAVRLENIQINTDRRMIGGEVIGVYDEEMSQIVNSDDIFEGGAMYGSVSIGTASTDLTVDFVIPENAIFVLDGDNISVKNDSGEIAGEIVLSGEEVFPLTVKDSGGNIYKLENENGVLKASKTGKENVPIPDGAVDYNRVASEKATVTFQKSGKYAFDTWIPQYENALLIRNKYKTVDDYRVPFKLIPPGKTDEVRAVIEIKSKDINPDKVIFKTPKGTEFESKYKASDKSYAVTVSGGEPGDGQELYALYPDGQGGWFNIGKLIVVSYPERTCGLTAVSVNGAAVDAKALSNKLNGIYNPIGISWEVTADTYAYQGDTEFMSKGSGLLSSYPEAMRTFHNTYLSERDIDDKTAVVFFFNRYGSGGEKDRNADGFMPRGKQFGYMFTQGFASEDDLYIGVAHELGHGMFQLKHPFDNDYKIPLGSTVNLMDYTPDATHIAKWQWDLIHDPGVILRVFERDEDAMRHLETLKDQEYLIRDGKINTNAWIYIYPSMQNMLKTETFQSFVSKLNGNSNISNLIFETMGPVRVASTGIAFITNVLRNDKWEVRLSDINQLTEEQYKTAKIALRIWYIKKDVDYNDIPFAHELFIHGISYIDEINKLDLKSMSLEQAKKKISEIMDKAYYDRNDEQDSGDKDHALFLIGKKEEMTNYLLERLESIKTDSEKRDYLYQIIKGNVGGMYNYIINDNISSNLVKHYQGGRKQLIKDVKKYLEDKFQKYHDLIFKTNPLWKEIDSTYGD